MIKLTSQGVYLVDGKLSNTSSTSPEEARKNTLAYSIMSAHNCSDTEGQMKIRFDALDYSNVCDVMGSQSIKSYLHLSLCVGTVVSIHNRVCNSIFSCLFGRRGRGVAELTVNEINSCGS